MVDIALFYHTRCTKGVASLAKQGRPVDCLMLVRETTFKECVEQVNKPPVTYTQCHDIEINSKHDCGCGIQYQSMSTPSKLQFGQQIQRGQAEDNQLPRSMVAITGVVGSLYCSQP